jgi:SAM-dependent methyltransferase
MLQLTTFMVDPLKIWRSEEVKELLELFYTKNFELSGVDINFAKNIIEKAWAARSLNPEQINEAQLEILKLFKLAKSQIKTRVLEKGPLELIDWSGVNTFLDIGANKFDTLNYLAHFHKDIEKLIAVDIIPQQGNFRYPEKSEYYQIDLENGDIPLLENSIDFINIQFVLHHFQDDQAIRKTLESCKKVLKPNGRLLLWEETFVENINIEKLVKVNSKLNIHTDHDLTDKFYKLVDDEKWEFIIINDWIINVGNEHMQWTGLYKKWSEWLVLFFEYGFELKMEYNLGLRSNGKLKQGVPMLGIFELKKFHENQ